MKIFFASQSFYPYIGGVSTYLLNLATGLKERGHEVAEVQLRPPHESGEEEIKQVNVYRVPKEPLDRKQLKGYSKFKETIYDEAHCFGKTFSKNPSEMEGFEEYNEINDLIGEQVFELMEQHPAEIVHVQDFQLLFLYRHIPRGVPTILTWHIPFSRRMSKNLQKFLVSHMQEYDKVVFSSPDYIKSAVKAGLRKDKSELIHPIANTRLFKKMKVNQEEVKQKFGLPKKSKVILCVQRVDRKSGHSQLIKAMPAVLKKVSDARLVFAGGKSMSSKISSARRKYELQVEGLVKKKNLGKKVVFAGNVPYEKLPELYNAVEVVALVSRVEGFGLSVTEAMACGKPVVGTKAGGIPLQVKNGFNGFLVPVGNHKATAKRLAELLEKGNLRKKMGENSLKTVEKKFGAHIGIEKHIALYNSLLRKKSESWNLRMLDFKDVSAILMDFDRTLTDRPGVVRKSVLNYLKKVKKPRVLVTGRNYRYVLGLEKKLPFFDAIVAENGAVIRFPEKKETIFIDSEQMADARRKLKKALFSVNAGKIIVSTEAKNSGKIKRFLGKSLKELAFKKNIDNVMVSPKEADKKRGVLFALQQLNLEPEKTVIFGDGENDVDLFNVPGFRVAVANAVPKLKALADQVTSKSRSAGLIEALQELQK